MMAEQIEHRDAIGRDGVMQPEFRDVIPHRLLPIKSPLVHKSAKPVAVNDFVIEQIVN